MLPLHLQGWKSGSDVVPSERQMRQVGWLSEEAEGSLALLEALVSVRCGGLNAGSFMMSGSGRSDVGEAAPSGVGIIGSAMVAVRREIERA